MAAKQPPTEPWERQPGEPSKAFLTFTIYRDLGTSRSLRKTLAIMCERGMSKSSGKWFPGHFQTWSLAWHWPERAAAYDGYLDKLGRQQHEDEVRAMNKRHITLAQALQSKAAAGLQALQATNLRQGNLLRYLIEAAKLERLARGEPEIIERRQVTDAPTGDRIDLSKLSLGEIIELERLVARALSVPPPAPAEDGKGEAPEPQAH